MHIFVYVNDILFIITRKINLELMKIIITIFCPALLIRISKWIELVRVFTPTSTINHPERRRILFYAVRRENYVFLFIYSLNTSGETCYN